MNRTLDDTDRMLEYAKLDKSELKPVVQCLMFTSHLDSDDVKFIEMDNSVLKCLQAGDCLTVRGLKTDSAVLCTKNETYEMKEAEISNALLLLPECRLNDGLSGDSELVVCQQVTAVRYDYYELRPVKPRLKRLRDRLEENFFTGHDDPGQTGRTYTFAELLDEVQASEAELLQSLKDLDACLVDGCWRLLDFDLMSTVFNNIIVAKDEMSYDRIPTTPLCSLLEELHPSQIVEHVLKMLSEPIDESSEERAYRLSEDKVCRFFAEMVLRSAIKFNLREFEETWQLAVPDGMKTNLSQLDGVALVDRDSKPEIIRFFPVGDLPEDTDERFQILFKTKDKWTLAEITPYIEGVCLDKLGVGALLTKYCRISTQKGTKLYSSKKP